ncbi:hypothetical protein AB0F71_32015 [Kitasatospora sp. NPDC028055]|uniref:hypothetical protein n=1 Tax=Kitasatospora sp. NPDC028055 TaxID=3155653 RepID=UPI0033CE8600
MTTNATLNSKVPQPRSAVLDDFPMEQVRPLLLGPDAPGLNRLYTAWVFATHGHDPQWIADHLGLPTPTARLLVTAARQQTR